MAPFNFRANAVNIFRLLYRNDDIVTTRVCVLKSRKSMFPPHGLYFDREFGEGSALGESTTKMAFTFAAFCYLLALILVAFCIFFAIFSVRKAICVFL